MTVEVTEYLETVLKQQTQLTFNIIDYLGKKLFPGDNSKLVELHSMVRDALEELHKKVAQPSTDSKEQV